MVERSNCEVRADVLHERLTAMGFDGGERTRRTVAAVKDAYRVSGWAMRSWQTACHG
ncbi:MAG: hypothetical protein HOU81_18605 [Hamadaea sp.]|uniref:hypothetical protein n=1 Tax=Hamadaea sp. TaxID=2024425 RepID=UPI0017D2032F|nr:hypothetical protein [Hamadaea sp.]NUR72829.1 hypothetical protein [Hamadaea sp.]NUT20456.1 hypothetical protein [Hamadaea sp.]